MMVVRVVKPGAFRVLNVGALSLALEAEGLGIARRSFLSF